MGHHVLIVCQIWRPPGILIASRPFTKASPAGSLHPLVSKLPQSASPYSSILLCMTLNMYAAYWIQVSGGSVLAADELASPSFVPGSASSNVFNDYDGVGDIQAIIRRHPTRAVDNYLLDTVSSDASIKTALVFPPIIYGEGEGPFNRRSIQIPSLARATIGLGRGLRIGAGENRWGNVHVRDVGRIFALLAKAAAEGNNSKGIWGKDGLYLTGVGEIVRQLSFPIFFYKKNRHQLIVGGKSFSDISSRVAAAAKEQGAIPNSDVAELAKDEYDAHLPHGKVLFGTNARGAATRARKLLGWEPREVSLEDDIPRATAEEYGK